jgi:hypothetical protein
MIRKILCLAFILVSMISASAQEDRNRTDIWTAVGPKESAPKSASLKRAEAVTLAVKALPQVVKDSKGYLPKVVSFSNKTKRWLIFFRRKIDGKSNELAIVVNESDRSTEYVPGY